MKKRTSLIFGGAALAAAVALGGYFSLKGSKPPGPAFTPFYYGKTTTSFEYSNYGNNPVIIPQGTILQFFGTDANGWVTYQTDTPIGAQTLDIPKNDLSPLPLGYFPKPVIGTLTSGRFFNYQSTENFPIDDLYYRSAPPLSALDQVNVGENEVELTTPGTPAWVCGTVGNQYIIAPGSLPPDLENNPCNMRADKSDVKVDPAAVANPIPLPLPGPVVYSAPTNPGAIITGGDTPHSSGTALLLFAVMLALQFGLPWYVGRKYAADKTPKSPVARGDLSPTFAEYQVPDGTFEKQGETLYRVNSNGLRINLEWWSFSKISGEWFRIVRHAEPSAIIENLTYSQRYVKFHGNPAARTIGMSIPIVVAIIGIILGIVSITTTSQLALYLAAPFMIAILSVSTMLATVLSRETESYSVGPEPLKRKTEDFGPGSAIASAQHPAADDLEYKPTV